LRATSCSRPHITTMKKKYRNITVDGHEYAWSAQDVVDECECPCTRVKIWRDKNTLIFDAVWGEPKHMDVSNLTPRLIADKIKSITANAKGDSHIMNEEREQVGEHPLVLRLREHAENAFVKYTSIEDDLNAAADLLEKLYPLTADLLPAERSR